MINKKKLSSDYHTKWIIFNRFIRFYLSEPKGTHTHTHTRVECQFSSEKSLVTHKCSCRNVDYTFNQMNIRFTNEYWLDVRSIIIHHDPIDWKNDRGLRGSKCICGKIQIIPYLSSQMYSLAGMHSNFVVIVIANCRFRKVLPWYARILFTFTLSPVRVCFV